MPITITVETGAIVDNANSYVSVANARAYAVNRGVTLSATDDVVAAQLIKATDYLEQFACRYQGTRVSSEQELEWPRIDAYLGEDLIPSNTIPKSLISAQCQLVMAQVAGFTLQPNVSATDYVVREKTGPLETEYADPFKVGIMPQLSAVDALLAPLFGECAASSGLRAVRV